MKKIKEITKSIVRLKGRAMPFYYTHKKNRGDRKLISDIKATKKLLGFLKKEGKFWFPVHTKRGVETSCLIETEKLKEVLIDKDILHLFVDITMEGFRREGITKELYDDVVNHILGYKKMMIILYGEDKFDFIKDKWQFDRLGAYCTYETYQLGGKKLLYIAGVMVYPDLQNLGYGGTLMEEAMKIEGADYMTYRTQNPQAYKAFKNRAEEIYPNGIAISEDIKKIANFIAYDVLNMTDFNSETMIGKGTYGKCLYGTLDEPKGDTRLVFNKINPWKGDSVIVVGTLRQ